MPFGGACWWVRSSVVGQKVKATSMTHSGMLHKRDISVLFLWATVVSDFRSLEIYKNLGLSLSTITFTVNSHTDNHFYKYLFVSNVILYSINLSQILYSVKSVFFMKKKYMLRILLFKFDSNVKHCSHFL